MFRLCSPLFSTALQPSNAFVKSALELVKLRYAHQSALEEKDHKIAGKIEEAFMNELYEFRPVFSVAQTVKVGRPYTKKIYSSLKYFGLNEDPLTRQLEAILGRQQRRSGSKIAIFRGGIGEQDGASHQKTPNANGQLDPRREGTISELPEERPLPAESVYSVLGDGNAGKPRHSRMLPDRHRGHWVLQDEDLMIKREDREVEPW